MTMNELMTVTQLIEHLKTFPPDAPVIRTFASDYDPVEAKDITLETVSFRGGRYCTYYDRKLYSDDEKPVYVRCVHIGGL